MPKLKSPTLSEALDFLSDDALKALQGAIATKGKNAGKFKARCPRMGTPAAVAWQTCMLSANPYKVSIGQTIFLPKELLPLRQEFLNWIDVYDLRRLDVDREALETLGVW